MKTYYEVQVRDIVHLKLVWFKWNTFSKFKDALKREKECNIKSRIVKKTEQVVWPVKKGKK